MLHLEDPSWVSLSWGLCPVLFIRKKVGGRTCRPFAPLWFSSQYPFTPTQPTLAALQPQIHKMAGAFSWSSLSNEMISPHFCWHWVGQKVNSVLFHNILYQDDYNNLQIPNSLYLVNFHQDVGNVSLKKRPGVLRRDQKRENKPVNKWWSYGNGCGHPGRPCSIDRTTHRLFRNLNVHGRSKEEERNHGIR